jgi:hypothetical protein
MAVTINVGDVEDIRRQAPIDNRQSVDQQLRTPSFRYKIGTTEREKKRYAAP